MARAHRPLVLLDQSPLVDTRREAGIGRYVSRLSSALAARDDIEVRTVRPARPPFHDSWAVRWLNAQPALAAAAVRWRPDLVHCLATDAAAVVPAARQVVTVMDVVPWDPDRSRPRSPTRAYLRYQRWRIPQCAAVVAISPPVATDVVEVLGVDPERVHVVPLGVEPVFHPVAAPDDALRRARVGVGEGPYVLWVGTLRSHDPRKQLDTLVDAVAALDCSTPTPTLTMAGAIGREAARLAELARRRGVRLRLCGFVDDETLAALYRGAAAVAVPSSHEGFGLPALEAMACAAPVVVARGGYLADLAGDAALAVDPGDVRGLRLALERLLLDPDLRTRLGTAGRRRADPFTWERCAAGVVEVYRCVFARRAGGWRRSRRRSR